ncbi:MAG: reprolysin-like metallopeptidase [Oscillochloridaceae bacterium umkhey_bin13]
MLARLLLYGCVIAVFTWIAVGFPQQVTPAAALDDPVALNSPFWQQPSALAPALATPPREDPLRYLTIQAVEEQIAAVLARAPHEASPRAWERAAILDLPLPDGSVAAFAFVASPVMEPGLAARYPQISTYLGQQQDDPSVTARLTRTQNGYHAFILGPTTSSYVTPYGGLDRSLHIAFASSDLPPIEFLPEPDLGSPEAASLAQSGSNGSMRRDYRLAIATTGEYAQFHGGTTASVMAEVVALVNATNAVFERDLAVRFTLVSNTDQLFFLDPATDPYPNDPNGDDRFELAIVNNQVTLDRLGVANFDIGHLLTTEPGGAGYGITCSSNPTEKARANSGAIQPTTARLLSLFLHEIGHQFGANHTFNSTSGLCGTSFEGLFNRSPSTAYEPGSGSTLMSYQGFCAPENVVGGDNLYFHIHNLIEMQTRFQAPFVTSCGVQLTPTGNSPPVVSAGPSYSIPARTPFELIGTASDPDGDQLTFTWEQYDLGSASPPLSDDGARPLFRSFSPSASPNRVFPQYLDITTRQASVGETLPTTNRTLNFRFTARDNRPGAGAFAFDSTALTVVATAGPFQITSIAGGERFAQGAQIPVQWDVANTNVAPISCANVQIDLTEDAGASYTTLLASTPNNGSANVTLPNRVMLAANLRVKCTNNIFLDLSPTFSTTGSIVTKTSDDNGTCTREDCALREAVALTNALPGANILELNAGVYQLSLSGAGPLVVSDPLTIEGAGPGQTIIDGGGLDRIFDLQANQVVLRNLTIRNGATDGDGGGIHSRANLTLENVVIAGNQAQGNGGGIHSRANLTLENVVVEGNQANVGGGIYNQGDLTLENVLVEGNQAEVGGGIFNRSGQLVVVKSIIRDNQTQGRGGGINATASLTIIDSTISENGADLNGGGVYFLSFTTGPRATLRIERSTLTNNEAGSGGGVYLATNYGTATGDMLIENSTLSGNTARSGGALFVEANTTQNVQPVLLHYNTIVNNSPSGIFWAGGSVTATGNIIATNGNRDCIFSTNAAERPDRLSSGGYNLVGDGSCLFEATGDQGGTLQASLNPRLAPLGNYGGTTLSHPPYADSPAVDAAGNTCPATDQRGQARPVGSACDIGAVERIASDPDRQRVYLPLIRR